MAFTHDERAAREHSDRQAAENARLLDALTERDALLEQLPEKQAALRRVATLVARDASVRRTGRSARVDDTSRARGRLADLVREEGCTVASPIVVEKRLWGAIGVGSRRRPLPADTEQRMADSPSSSLSRTRKAGPS